MDFLAFDIGNKFSSPVGKGDFGFAALVSIILSNAIALAGIILLILLVLGGIGYISGAGQNNPQRAAQGKAAITAAIIGFVIIFASYWIIEAVEVLTGLDILDSGL